MKNRFFTFLTMLLTVIVVGTGATMLNLRMQRKSAESLEGASFQILDQASPETGAGMGKTQSNSIRGTQAKGVQWNNTLPEIETADPTQPADVSGGTLPAVEEQSFYEPDVSLEMETAPTEVQDSERLDQESITDSMEEVLQSVSGNERQVYYARLQDMERAYTARMNAAAKESLTAQQKTADELLEIWDDELNAIYQKLRASLADDDFRVLRSEERAWIRNRDAAANKAAAGENYSKSAQKLAYTHSLLQWTKERVYQLAKMYYGE